MKEKLQTYALVAEIVGALAVVLSLVYVGIQIQEGTQQARLDSIRTMNEGYQQQAMNYVHNEALGIAWHKILEGEVLTKREVDMFGDNLFANLMLLEETWNAVKAGYLDEAFLDSKIALIETKILASPQIRERHALMVENRIYTPEFIAWLDEQLQRSSLYAATDPVVSPE
jgi:hypothetical protein